MGAGNYDFGRQALCCFRHACQNHTESASQKKGIPRDGPPCACKGRDTEEWSGTRSHTEILVNLV